MTAIAKRKRRPPGPATDRQLEVLAAIKRLTAEKGYAPIIRELMAACGLSSTYGMSCHLNALEKRGLIRRKPGSGRSIVVIEQNDTGDVDDDAAPRDEDADAIDKIARIVRRPVDGLIEHADAIQAIRAIVDERRKP